jgi:hypothetical protein
VEKSHGIHSDSAHPLGEAVRVENSSISKAIEVETFAGKGHVEWDPTAAVTPIGQLPFFIEFLKLGHRFNPWVEDCPLHYTSNNAPKKIDVLGSLFLSILSGHNRYTHLTALRGDSVNTQLLGMNKIVSDDSAIRALKRMAQVPAINWLQNHLQSCYEPLLTTPWILDVAYMDVGKGRELGAVALMSQSNPFTGIKKVPKWVITPISQGDPPIPITAI